MYNFFKNLENNLKNQFPIITHISPKNINTTYFISVPGYYLLTDDILYNPILSIDQDMSKINIYPSIITIQSDNVILDLNGHCIQQNNIYHQRYFTLINILNCKNIIITNGKLGLSSKNSIFCHNIQSTIFSKLSIYHFEQNGIKIINGSKILFDNIKIGPNRQNIPISSNYDAALLLSQYAKHILCSHNQLLSINQSEKLQSYKSLLDIRISNTTQNLLSNNTLSDPLFTNSQKMLPDIPSHAIFITSSNHTDINFTDESQHLKLCENETLDENIGWKSLYCKNIYINQVNIDNINVKIKHIIGISQSDSNGIQKDVVGNVFNIERILDTNMNPKKDELSNIQILLAEILYYKKPSITMDVINWYHNKISIDNLFSIGYKFVNAYSNYSGSTGLTLYSIKNSGLENLKISNIINESTITIPLDHDISNNSYGILIINNHKCVLGNIKIDNICSSNGASHGISIDKSSKIAMDNINVKCIYAGNIVDGKYIGINNNETNIPYSLTYSKTIPYSVGIKIDENCENVDVFNRKIKYLYSPSCNVPLWQK